MSKHAIKEYFDEQGNLIIKPYRLKDLAAIFDINTQTLKRWMSRHPDELSCKTGKFYSINQVEFMIDQFGLPKKLAVHVSHPSAKQAA
ncbi:hypothetical protein SAMN05444410_10188 [Hydrobacter penzbergensis]|jgi:hypothetical protein|uniref:Uncharacterized protein n=1 Tax=Hydrobacter penzbergensis TaxID=1235997 RepID=A0A8X8ID63_9BACT|nr:hypothetical protein [Hydrobacter penzbergensis]SDW03950.1 hypothetical protein SAMN05444410_10188 [Hydrobacter penzbergensis]